MTVECASCGKPFQAQRSTAKFCGATCRKRASDRSKAEVAPEASSRLVAVVRRDLEAAGRLDSPLGQSAMELAERMGSPFSTGSAIAAVSRELRAVMTQALADAPRADTLDELSERRRHRISA